ncbi:MAG: Myo-inositol 2-dehydrogenase [Verrucomicrobiales bacterium]|nr:Myo-inositol 2-dehydrogenase [Verrucomicrobiales bacterium]
MKFLRFFASLFLLLPGASAAESAGAAKDGAGLRLHPENPHYFEWKGRPVVLITSGEHYGAVMNRAFDYQKYLDTLAADGLNYTRIFSGAYLEPQGAFNIARNTMAPAADQFICPWARSGQPGFALGGDKFDLNQWDAAYFVRLKDFVSAASSKGVIVEVTLFCPMYEEMQWKLSPMNATNNINGVGAVGMHEVHTLDRSGGLLKVQETLVRKLVTELNGMDNVIFEICNEPYFGGVTLDWQHRIADMIVETESALPRRHLIAQNIANNTAKIEKPHSAVSIFNFHYAAPPDAVRENFALNKVIGDDETGFNGTDDRAYRIEAWNFILAGGGLFNNLDYSFTVGTEDGTFAYPKTQPGGGGVSYRKQLGILREFINGFDFVRMRPGTSVVERRGLPEGTSIRGLEETGKAMALFLHSPRSAVSSLRVNLPAGPWEAQWVNVLTGEKANVLKLEGGGIREIKLPAYDAEIALGLKKPGP